MKVYVNENKRNRKLPFFFREEYEDTENQALEEVIRSPRFKCHKMTRTETLNCEKNVLLLFYDGRFPLSYFLLHTTFSLNEFRWISWIMKNKRRGCMVTVDATCLATDISPMIGIECTFSLVLLGKCLLPLTTLR